MPRLLLIMNFESVFLICVSCIHITLQCCLVSQCITCLLFRAEFKPFTLHEINYKLAILFLFSCNHHAIIITYSERSDILSAINLFICSSVLIVFFLPPCSKLMPVGCSHLYHMFFFLNLSVSFLNDFLSISTCLGNSFIIYTFLPLDSNGF